MRGEHHCTMDSASRIVIWALVAGFLLIVSASIIGAFMGLPLQDKTLEWCGMILLALVGLLKNTDRTPPQPQDVTVVNPKSDPLPVTQTDEEPKESKK